MDENGLILKSQLNQSEGAQSYYYHNVRTTYFGSFYLEIQHSPTSSLKFFNIERQSQNENRCDNSDLLISRIIDDRSQNELI